MVVSGRDSGTESSVAESRVTETRVDMGEDLLEGTLLAEIQATAVDPQGRLADQLESARILASEGLLEEAKKVLRRIILVDPHCVPARKRLEEIHETELRQIFGDAAEPPRKLPSDRAPDSREMEQARVSSEDIMRRLDRDLSLGIFGDGAGSGGEAREMERIVFGSPGEMERFAARLEEDLAGAAGRDRMDIGIAFLEMGLFELAMRQFRVAMRDPEVELAAAFLNAQALIAADRPFDATLELEALLGEAETPREYRVHLIYLMARACEALGRSDAARLRYEQVAELEPGYRDVRDRLRLLGGGKPGARQK